MKFNFEGKIDFRNFMGKWRGFKRRSRHFRTVCSKILICLSKTLRKIRQISLISTLEKGKIKKSKNWKKKFQESSKNCEKTNLRMINNASRAKWHFWRQFSKSIKMAEVGAQTGGNQARDPLINVRDRLFHTLFFKLSVAYARGSF